MNTDQATREHLEKRVQELSIKLKQALNDAGECSRKDQLRSHWRRVEELKERKEWSEKLLKGMRVE